MTAQLNNLLVTGAAGIVAQLIMKQLAELTVSLRLSDIKTPDFVPENAEFIECDITCEAGVEKLVKGCDGVVHLGGVSTEQSFESIIGPNIRGIHNLYEAARLHGQPRIVMASSNHAIGFYRQNERIDSKATPRPDGWYGVSKVFGEAVASMYFDKFGQETAIVRIGSCFAEPKDFRMLTTWLAPSDFAELIKCVFSIPVLGCPIIYGVSDNASKWWDNRNVRCLGWTPRNNTESFVAKFDNARPSKNDPAAIYHGGHFTAFPIYKDPIQ